MQQPDGLYVVPRFKKKKPQTQNSMAKLEKKPPLSLSSS